MAGPISNNPPIVYSHKNAQGQWDKASGEEIKKFVSSTIGKLDKPSGSDKADGLISYNELGPKHELLGAEINPTAWKTLTGTDGKLSKQELYAFVVAADQTQAGGATAVGDGQFTPDEVKQAISQFSTPNAQQAQNGGSLDEIQARQYIGLQQYANAGDSERLFGENPEWAPMLKQAGKPANTSKVPTTEDNTTNQADPTKDPTVALAAQSKDLATQVQSDLDQLAQALLSKLPKEQAQAAYQLLGQGIGDAVNKVLTDGQSPDIEGIVKKAGLPPELAQQVLPLVAQTAQAEYKLASLQAQDEASKPPANGAPAPNSSQQVTAPTDLAPPPSDAQSVPAQNATAGADTPDAPPPGNPAGADTPDPASTVSPQTPRSPDNAETERLQPDKPANIVDLATLVKQKATDADPEHNGLLTMDQMDKAADALAQQDPSLKSTVDQLKQTMHKTEINGKKIWQTNGGDSTNKIGKDDNGSLSDTEWGAFMQSIGGTAQASPAAAPGPANAPTSSAPANPNAPAAPAPAPAAAAPTEPKSVNIGGKEVPNRPITLSNGSQVPLATLMKEGKVNGDTIEYQGGTTTRQQIGEAIKASAPSQPNQSDPKTNPLLTFPDGLKVNLQTLAKEGKVSADGKSIEYQGRTYTKDVFDAVVAQAKQKIDQQQ